MYLCYFYFEEDRKHEQKKKSLGIGRDGLLWAGDWGQSTIEKGLAGWRWEGNPMAKVRT